ncbi:alpha/beta hydrolase [Embleya sp. NPDC050493]|uniref:alpha/beta hydrolase n=1 Tax=Embleya sp. NPDC050493 TaxID=3363989 RepID=UPI00378F866D
MSDASVDMDVNPAKRDAVNVDAELDVAFDARATVGPERFARLMERYRAESVQAVTDLPGVTGLVYDAPSGERLDVWGPGSEEAPRPVFVFVHGGYWRALSRADSAFAARMLAERGVATVVPDYTLAPRATLEEITRQVRATIAWVYHEGARYGLDRSRLVVGGSSAGGHLAAMTMVDGWQAEVGLPENVVAAGFPISGLFDVRPLVRTRANEWLRFDEERAAALSPLVLGARPRMPGVTVMARHEASGFTEQSRAFAAHWGTELLVVPERNHFDVVLDLADPETAMSRALLGLFDRL